MAAETLYRERRLSVNAIAQKLHVSKSTLYSYLRHRSVEIGPYEKPNQARPIGQTGAGSGIKTATILLWLRVENNSKFVRGKKRAKENIVRYPLKEYAAKLRPSGEYELKIPYRTDEDVDKTMDDLLSEIAREADLRHCFSESDAHLEGSDRSW